MRSPKAPVPGDGGLVTTGDGLGLGLALGLGVGLGVVVGFGVEVGWGSAPGGAAPNA